MDIFRKIDKLRIARGWSFYKLSQETGLAQQTFTQWMNGTMPSIPALKCVCDAFEISLAEFFSDENTITSTPDTIELIEGYKLLTKSEKQSVLAIIKNYLNKNK